MKKNLGHYRPLKHIRVATGFFTLFLSLHSTAVIDLKEAEKAVRVRQYDTAFKLYQEAAVAGNAEAQYQLSNLYASGRGIKSDDSLVLSWLEKSAAQSHSAAQYGLATKILNQDYYRALELMSESAEQGYIPAKRHLERLQSKLKATWKNDQPQDKIWFGLAQNNRVDEMLRLHVTENKIDRQDDAKRTAVFTAIESGSIDVLKWLLKMGANPNHIDKFGLSPVFVAASKNSIESLRILLKNGAKANRTLENGDNLLHYSIRRESFNLVPYLLKNGVSKNQVNDDGWTPLDLAKYAKAEKTAAKLLNAGGKTGNSWNNQKIDNTGSDINKLAEYTASETSLANLAKVVISGNVSLLEELMKRDEQRDRVNQRLEDGSTLMSLAIKESNVAMVETLLASGSYPSVPTFSGIRPLHMAARDGKLKVIELLLDAGADPLKRDDQGRDAIQWAIQEQQQAAGSLLLNHLFSNKKFDIKKGPIDNYILAASQYNMDSLVVKLGPQASTSAADGFGRNALWFAAQNKNAAIIPLLLRYKVPADLPDHEGKTPFYVAVSEDCLACAEQLLKYVDINKTTNTGNSPLIAAVENRNYLLVEWLLKNGANIEQTNEMRNTALISAVEVESQDIVRLLIEAGANISRKNNLGFSALDIAKKNNKTIHEYLRSRSLLGAF